MTVKSSQRRGPWQMSAAGGAVRGEMAAAGCGLGLVVAVASVGLHGGCHVPGGSASPTPGLRFDAARAFARSAAPRAVATVDRAASATLSASSAISVDAIASASA